MSDNICCSFADHLQQYVGETITLYTLSCGQCGCGFTGVLLSVNSCYCRLLTSIGSAPGSGQSGGCGRRGCSCGQGGGSNISVGSVTDVPVDMIAALVHNAL
ncbi:hypothetical protein SDC9_129290 [bioreactor metagenome]|uniref:Uncharacterized protein n=1 Tax=bioreactor metagenome TaxID=1076179 RepID=A0A645CZ90_9ZZZZ